MIRELNIDPQSSRKKIVAIDLFETPLNWAEITARFPANGIQLEVGSGKGLFLASAATAEPEKHFVGIELAGKFANRAAQRIGKAGIANATMLRGDAKVFLEKVVPDSSLERLHVYFPDPWWRNKHKKRRVLNEQTIQDIQRVLAPGGEFHFWTDVLDYYEHICGDVMDQTQMYGPRYVPEPPSSHSMDYTTHFERRARLNSQPVYRAVFQKTT
jgi:tRNA (guanine-N7-)-methyltransferase